MLISGTVASTAQLRAAGVGSTLPAASVTRSRKVCEPLAKAGYPAGERHPMNSPARGRTRRWTPPRSRRR